MNVIEHRAHSHYNITAERSRARVCVCVCAPTRTSAPNVGLAFPLGLCGFVVGKGVPALAIVQEIFKHDGIVVDKRIPCFPQRENNKVDKSDLCFWNVDFFSVVKRPNRYVPFLLKVSLHEGWWWW